jgi:hypothetical protein
MQFKKADNFFIAFKNNMAYIVVSSYDFSLRFNDLLIHELQSTKFKGTVLIDMLLKTGNNQNRYSSIIFDGEKLDITNFQRISNPKIFWELEKDIFITHKNIIENSILPDYQKALILQGKAI